MNYKNKRLGRFKYVVHEKKFVNNKIRYLVTFRNVYTGFEVTGWFVPLKYLTEDWLLQNYDFGE